MKLILIIAAIAIVLLIARSVWGKGTSGTGVKTAKSPGVSATNSRVQARSPYRATSVICGENACSAAREIQGTRFLDVDRNVPKLPLTGCDAGHCACTYEHHDDRRSSDEDRRHPNALQADLYAHSGNEERRSTRRGRRKTDVA